jgi:hypothetical protein
MVLGVLLAALTQSCASSISFLLGLYVVERVVTPLDGWDRVSDHNNKLERGIIYRQVRPTNSGLTALSTEPDAVACGSGSSSSIVTRFLVLYRVRRYWRISPMIRRSNF